MEASAGRTQAVTGNGLRYPEFLGQFAQGLGLPVRSSTVFGDPIERGAVTIIPVAWGIWGMGGAEEEGGGQARMEGDLSRAHGQGEASMPAGEAGGGGGLARPLGFIEIRDGTARFRRIVDPLGLGMIMLSGALAAAIVLRGLRKLV